MKLSYLIFVFAMFSSLAFAQNEDETTKPGINNVLEPAFNGTTEVPGIKEYIEGNLCLPKIAQTWGVEGTVVVHFKVLPTRDLSEFQVIQSLSPEFDKAVIVALQSTNGMWSPGTIDGRPSSMEKEMIVVFKNEGSQLYTTAQLNKERADDLLQEGKYSRAIKLYTKSIGSCPTSEISIYRRGLSKYYIGDLEGALNDFERVSDLGSHLADPMLTRLHEVVVCANKELQLSSIL